MGLRILTADDVRAALPMADAIDAMREAFAAVSDGRADLPIRTRIDLGDEVGSTLTMPAAMRDPVRLGAKLLTVFPGNPARGHSLIHGLVVMFDPDTGRPSGLLEGQTLTALRTGAASGLATDLLAREDARRVGIIGSGVQARTQLEAICCVREVAEVAVYSPTAGHAARFGDEMRRIPRVPDVIRVVGSAAEAAAGADIICTATTAPTPVIVASQVAAGAHVNAIGSYTPEMQELGTDLLARARLVVDQVAAAVQEAGELIRGLEEGVVERSALAELGAVVAGVAPARQRRDEITVFKSVGLAVQDLCAAARALARAERDAIGTLLPL